MVSSRRSYILRSSEARGRAKLVAKYQPPERHSVLAGGNHGIVASRVLAVVLSLYSSEPESANATKNSKQLCRQSSKGHGRGAPERRAGTRRGPRPPARWMMIGWGMNLMIKRWNGRMSTGVATPLTITTGGGGAAKVRMHIRPRRTARAIKVLYRRPPRWQQGRRIVDLLRAYRRVNNKMRQQGAQRAEPRLGRQRLRVKTQVGFTQMVQ